MKVNQTVDKGIIPKNTPQPLTTVGGTGGADGPSGPGGPGRPGDSGDSGDPAIKTSTFVMNKIKSRINAEPEIRTESVEKYKNLIKSGEYKVDPDKLATKLISDTLDEDIS